MRTWTKREINEITGKRNSVWKRGANSNKMKVAKKNLSEKQKKKIETRGGEAATAGDQWSETKKQPCTARKKQKKRCGVDHGKFPVPAVNNRKRAGTRR